MPIPPAPKRTFGSNPGWTKDAKQKTTDFSDWDKPLDPVDWSKIERKPFARSFLQLSKRNGACAQQHQAEIAPTSGKKAKARSSKQSGLFSLGDRIAVLRSFRSNDAAEQRIRLTKAETGTVQDNVGGWALILFDRDPALCHWVKPRNLAKVHKAECSPVKAKILKPKAAKIRRQVLAGELPSQEDGIGQAEAGVAERRVALQIRIDEDPFGDCPDPINSFDELAMLPRYVLQSLQEHSITAPMPIQAQALPLVLGGRDVIGLAQTGSGKTLAFLLPAVVHIEAQKPLPRDEVSPIVLVMAPTRELAVQISDEAAKVLSRSSASEVHTGGIWAGCAYGGGDKRQQLQKLRGSHILAATPGRLIDFVREGKVSLKRVTYFVLDEADRMLDLGFSGDVAGLSGQIRPERQVLFFSATWSKDVQELAAGLCHNGARPVRICYGQAAAGEAEGSGHTARKGITQQVVVVDEGGNWEKQEKIKRGILDKHLRDVLEASDENKVLVFVSQKNLADDLAQRLKGEGFKADSMHGGKAQEYRLWVLDEFRKSRLRLLVCTDVLGRGIDIPDVSHVVIHEMGYIEDYIHRIGRTARGKSSVKGHALVFFEYWHGEPKLASQLIDVLTASEQQVPASLQKIADEVAAGKRTS